MKRRGAWPALLPLALLGGALPACGPTTQDLEVAQIHYDLGVNAMQNGHDAQGAIKELQIALKSNASMADAQNALGLVYHLMLHRPDEAVLHYQAALRMDPKDSEAANNLGAALIDLGRYPEAVEAFQRALSNDLYRTPYVAQGNWGWTLYKQGDTAGGLARLHAAVQVNPDYCQGYRSLGMIYSEQGQLADAQREYEDFVRHCGTVAESHYRLGLTLLKRGDQPRAREQLGLCSSAGAEDLAVECERLLKLMQ